MKTISWSQKPKHPMSDMSELEVMRAYRKIHTATPTQRDAFTKALEKLMERKTGPQKIG